MSWKAVMSFVIVILLIGLFTFYFLPIGEIVEFSVAGSGGSSNFTLEGSNATEGMQFYDNMRYYDSSISYNIADCPVNKLDEMKRAFDVVEAATVLDFYETDFDQQISVTCDSSVKTSGRAFVAGEGGVTNVTQSGDFNVIAQGQVLLLRESKCADPIVGTHELFHALGFDHSENDNNIMYPTVDCDQEISQDMIDHLAWLYSFTALPDLMFEEASASMQGKYLSLSVTVKNHGLVDSYPAKMVVYADGKSVKDFDLDEIPVGGGKMITLSNILVKQLSVDEIEIVLESEYEEMEKDNNAVVLKIKSS